MRVINGHEQDKQSLIAEERKKWGHVKYVVWLLRKEKSEVMPIM